MTKASPEVVHSEKTASARCLDNSFMFFQELGFSIGEILIPIVIDWMSDSLALNRKRRIGRERKKEE